MCFDFTQFRYFEVENVSIYRCDRRTHEACIFDKLKNEWQPTKFNLRLNLNNFHPIAIDMMDYFERRCRLGCNSDHDGFDWVGMSELIPRDEDVNHFVLRRDTDRNWYIRTKKYFVNNYSYIVLAAAHLAQDLHWGQTDKAGENYFFAHLVPVGALGKTWKEQVVGLLHDAAEDTPHNVDEIIELLKNRIDVVLNLVRLPWIWELEQKLHLTTGASCDRPSKDDWFELAEALTALNHHLYPSREIYINHIKTNPLATKVKLNDLANNMDMSRVNHPTEEDWVRTLRYKQEYEFLSKK